MPIKRLFRFLQSMALVLLMSLMSLGMDGECHGDALIDCFSCESHSGQADHYCGDPFNDTHPELEKVTCDGMCAKWVLELGRHMKYIRTCSTNIKMKMHVNPVCMRERQSHFGHLCFCRERDCNSSPLSSSPSPLLALSLALLALLFPHR